MRTHQPTPSLVNRSNVVNLSFSLREKHSDLLVHQISNNSARCGREKTCRQTIGLTEITGSE